MILSYLLVISIALMLVGVSAAIEAFSPKTIWKYDHNTLNMSNLRNTLLEINAKREIQGMQNSTSCGYLPKKAVILTPMNAGFIDSIRYQKLGMEAGESWSNCLDQVYVVVCLDSQAVKLCRAENITYCVEQPFPQLLPFSEYGKDAYQYLTWLKHTFIFEALKTMENVFFFDSDIVIFKNPFGEAQYGRDEKGKQFPFEYDFLFQRGFGRGKGCHGTVNSGMMHFRNTTAVYRFFDCLWKEKAEVVRKFTFYDLEQGYVQKCKPISNMTSCVLDADKFIHVSHSARNHDPKAPLKDVIAFHAAGGKRGYKYKIQRMAKIVGDYKANSQNRISTYTG